VVEADVVFGVVEDGGREIWGRRVGNGFGHGELMMGTGVKGRRLLIKIRK
jgi:hypothetical protein